MSDIPINTVFFDISTLLSFHGNKIPAGLTRVEMEYGYYLSKNPHVHLEFVSDQEDDVCLLNKEHVLKFLNLLKQKWQKDDTSVDVEKAYADVVNNAIPSRREDFPQEMCERPGKSFHIVTNCCRIGDHRLDPIKNFCQKTHSFFITMIHDVLALDFPEYFPESFGYHKTEVRLNTISKCANGVIVPTDVVGNRIRGLLPKEISIKTILHGLDHFIDISKRFANFTPLFKGFSLPFFVCIGTIEPRKNHLLLLNIWREMLKRLPRERVPHLVIIGHRGWRNEQVVNMLDDCRIIKDHVHEYNDLNDEQVAYLLKTCRGLLYPAYGEGYGMPLLEAIAIDTPAVCSDIPVFREIAKNVAIYLDPNDGPGWTRAIMHLSSTHRKSLEELFPGAKDFRPPLWPSQINNLLSWMENDFHHPQENQQA